MEQMNPFEGAQCPIPISDYPAIALAHSGGRPSLILIDRMFVPTFIPVPEQVRGACEILGFAPLYVANEGKCLAKS